MSRLVVVCIGCLHQAPTESGAAGGISPIGVEIPASSSPSQPQCPQHLQPKVILGSVEGIGCRRAPSLIARLVDLTYYPQLQHAILAAGPQSHPGYSKSLTRWANRSLIKRHNAISRPWSSQNLTYKKRHPAVYGCLVIGVS